MGSIRMVLLDGLSVADLLALRQGGFFEGAAVALPSTGEVVRAAPAVVAGHSVEGPVSGGSFRLVKPQAITVHEPPADSGVKVSVTAAVQEAVPTASYSAPVAVPAGALSVAAPTPEQLALSAQIRQELAEIRAEHGLPPPSDARSGAESGIDPAPVPIVAPDAPTAGGPRPVTIDQLAACTKLRDLLQLLTDGGMATADLTPYLESVREQVPLLQRISNIGERVARTLSVMGAGA